MGFRKDAYATVWQIESVSNTLTKGRISIDRKNKETDQYEQEFGGFVSFVGTACAAKAMRLKEKDRIKLGDVDVTLRYDKEKKREYTTFKIFSFDDVTLDRGGSAAQPKPAPKNTMYDGEPTEEAADLPF